MRTISPSSEMGSVMPMGRASVAANRSVTPMSSGLSTLKPELAARSKDPLRDSILTGMGIMGMSTTGSWGDAQPENSSTTAKKDRNRDMSVGK